MKKIAVLCLLTVSCITYISFNIPGSKTNAAYPEGYRNWAHIKSGIVGAKSPAAPKYEGFTHIYGNEKAMEGYRTGKFPDGAIIVFDVLEASTNEGGTSEGKRKFIDVMRKDSKLYASTGGWNYEEYLATDKSNDALTVDEKTKCINCHQSKKNNDYVFSALRD